MGIIYVKYTFAAFKPLYIIVLRGFKYTRITIIIAV